MQFAGVQGIRFLMALIFYWKQIQIIKTQTIIRVKQTAVLVLVPKNGQDMFWPQKASTSKADLSEACPGYGSPACKTTGGYSSDISSWAQRALDSSHRPPQRPGSLAYLKDLKGLKFGEIKGSNIQRVAQRGFDPLDSQVLPVHHGLQNPRSPMIYEKYRKQINK